MTRISASVRRPSTRVRRKRIAVVGSIAASGSQPGRRATGSTGFQAVEPGGRIQALPPIVTNAIAGCRSDGVPAASEPATSALRTTVVLPSTQVALPSARTL